MKNNIIYFDNAATTFPKPDSVSASVLDCLENYSGNPGRSGHRLSLLASEKVYETREKIADFLNYDSPERVVFTSGATFALNLAMRSLIKEKSHILISDMEHNSVLRVAKALEVSKGVKYDVFNSENLEESVKSLVRKNTSYIVTTLQSNVNGQSLDVIRLSNVCEMYGIGLILDASQLLGHEAFSLENVKFDALCAAGHKGLFGLQGVGFAIFGKSAELGCGLVVGGSGTDSKNLEMPETLPDRFEAGTLPLPAIASLCAGIDFINSVGLDTIATKLDFLTEKLINGLSSLEGVEKYGGRRGIVYFTVKNMGSEELSKKLDEYGICVRGGFHCAPLAHKKLGTYEGGAVRVSFSYFNTSDEVERFLSVLSHIIKEN